jgi:hypothetical protein
MTTAFDNEESLNPEEILLRFKKVLGRDMTPEERRDFFLASSQAREILMPETHARDPRCVRYRTYERAVFGV